LQKMNKTKKNKLSFGTSKLASLKEQLVHNFNSFSL
jgi:hypothetical protein